MARFLARKPVPVPHLDNPGAVSIINGNFLHVFSALSDKIEVGSVTTSVTVTLASINSENYYVFAFPRSDIGSGNSMWVEQATGSFFINSSATVTFNFAVLGNP